MEENGQALYSFVKKIFPYNRSLTGEGVRQTLKDIDEYIGGGLNITEVPSGTKVFDWTVPKEWEISEGYIEDESGKRIIDFHENNLYVVGYSIPVDEWVNREELIKHIYVLDDEPDYIPYVTSYYVERYGFCMSKNMRDSLTDGKYHMVIKSRLFDGNLELAEAVIPGESKDEILITSYFCHPSMANNECSGLAVWSELVKYVRSLGKHYYTYRFVLNPETIGSISYISRNLENLKKNVKAGFVLSCVGDDRAYSMVHTKNAGTLADRVLHNELKYKDNFKEYTFRNRGSDERQYNAPGVDIPVVSFSRSKYCEYPEYHTSADDLCLVTPTGLGGAYEVMKDVITVLENNYYFRTTVLCEPQLGKRGLFPTVSKKGSYDSIHSMMDFILYADGNYDLIELADKSLCPAKELVELSKKLIDGGIMERLDRA